MVTGNSGFGRGGFEDHYTEVPDAYLLINRGRRSKSKEKMKKEWQWNDVELNKTRSL